MNDLRLDLKWKIREFIDSVDDKYCDGCYFLNIDPPFRGATSCDVNAWRDNYKCRCDNFNMMWLNGRKDNIPRCLECFITDSKELIK
jgi:hypothetical protein